MPADCSVSYFGICKSPKCGNFSTVINGFTGGRFICGGRLSIFGALVLLVTMVAATSVTSKVFSSAVFTGSLSFVTAFLTKALLFLVPKIPIQTPTFLKDFMVFICGDSMKNQNIIVR